MSAELLRRASALMREQAEAATPGPWRFTDSEAVNDVWDGGVVVISNDADPIANVQDEWYENDPGEPAPVNDAEHIASWHPLVALAVADQLDGAAAIIDEASDGPLAIVATGLAEKSLAVARAYLGSDAC